MNTGELEAVKKEKLIHVSTVGRKTGKAHTVEVWFAVADGAIYFSHEGAPTDWMKNIDANARVGVKIGKLKFEADAKIVKSGAPRESGKKALYEKYYGPASKEIIDDWFSLSQVIQMSPV
jgi:deazaflavin-dependent oxidoreductase (nitroreductase family)